MNELTKIIKSQIKMHGSITFCKFMELALYHKDFGYYTAGRDRIGKKGDFYTSPCVHPAFGEIIGRFIKKSSELVDAKNFKVIEMGAGKGYLALDILDSIKSNYPELYTNLRYLISETSPAQIEDGMKLLSEHNNRVSWIDSISDLENSSVSGVFLSNELLDSFPFHRVKYTDHKIMEIYVGRNNNEFIEIEGEPSFPEFKDYLETCGLEFLDGQEFEVRTNVKKWLLEVSRILDKGFVLTIDYGFLAPELFNPSRTKGTYKCMHKHAINDNPYINIGVQDITAHVDFSNLITIGESFGLKTIKYITQGQFLIDWGILDILERYSSDERSVNSQKEILAIKNLFLPSLMGDRFKALIQYKNLDGKISTFYPKSPLQISFQGSMDLY